LIKWDTDNSVAGHQVIIGSKVFRSKSDALLFFKEMLGRYHNKQDVNEEDSRHLRNNLERHPNAREKIGCGVTRFFKDWEGPKECFWLERENGTLDHFSYEPGVTGKLKSH
jgi:Protein of unknown function (DUF3223)